jgi:DNA-binding MurR/RpiR family transcriptional regulator
MVNTSQPDPQTKRVSLSKKVKIRKGININPNPLEKFKQKIIEQSETAPKKQTDEELNRELEVELPIGSQAGINSEEQIEAKLKDKIKLANHISNSDLGGVELEEVVSAPLTAEFYIVQFSGLDIEALNSKLQELQKPVTIIEDKDLQIEAVQKLIQENIEAAEKVNGDA